MRLTAGSVMAAALVLAGCGGYSGDAKAVHDMCTANGGKSDYCDCITKTLEAKLSKEAFADIAKGGTEGALNANLDAIDEANKACAKP